MSFFSKAKPTTAQQVKSIGGIVVAAYLLQVGVSALDGLIKGTFGFCATQAQNGKTALAMRRQASKSAALAQADTAAEEVAAVAPAAEEPAKA